MRAEIKAERLSAKERESSAIARVTFRCSVESAARCCTRARQRALTTTGAARKSQEFERERALLKRDNMLRITILAALLLTICAPAFGQDSTAELTAKYTATYTALLDSESDATERVMMAQAYSQKAPFRFETVLSTIQKLLASRLTPKARKAVEIFPLIVPCGDAAVAADGGDFAFSECVLLINGISTSGNASIYVPLTRLDALGIPVFRLIAVWIGRPVETVKTMAYQGRLRPSVVAEMLLAAFRTSYGGFAEKAKRAEP